MLDQLRQSVEGLRKKIARTKSECKRLQGLLDCADEVPTLDKYIDLKISQERMEKQCKAEERKKHLESLRAHRQKRGQSLSIQASSKGVDHCQRLQPAAASGIVSNGHSSTGLKAKQGRLFKGNTFDLVYAIPLGPVVSETERPAPVVTRASVGGDRG